MSLANLKLTTANRPVPAFRASPTEKARAAILANIDVQRALVKVERGEAVALTKQVKKVDEDGSVITATVDRKPRKWFWKNPQGVFVLEMLFNNQPVVIAIVFVPRPGGECGTRQESCRAFRRPTRRWRVLRRVTSMLGCRMGS